MTDLYDQALELAHFRTKNPDEQYSLTITLKELKELLATTV